MALPTMSCLLVGGGRLGGGGKVADEGGDGQDGEGMDGNGEGREGYYFKCIV